MGELLFGTTLLVSFFGGMVAWLAPCCLSVMLPIGLGATVLSRLLVEQHVWRRHRESLVPARESCVQDREFRVRSTWTSPPRAPSVSGATTIDTAPVGETSHVEC
ncbi:hypothetical protein [Qaidamihabitans albus]|uniref:hypothetical protein n=1 Tax=Qaidamihabitans albus TaxID=2795733 RepID=UPI0018F1B696|nr:hypothetical protein [Qaidamihabitans albus]